MASKGMWEVDPETRSKLLAIQKESSNSLCCDCGAPSPQWASPKFGVFICLSCAGVHRGLGVHISFVRSISMDAFKPAEIERMRLGGNARWRDFFEKHPDTELRGISWDDATIAERYGGEAGEEYKERLSASVEGRVYVPGDRKNKRNGSIGAGAATAAGGSSAPLSGTADSSRSGGGGGSYRDDSRSGSPSGGVGNKTRVDDKYFARLGADNAARPDDLPPSQGGKYAGFGNTPMPAQRSSGGAALPTMDELQANPVAAFTKGFGWFASTVTKTATTVNSNYIQPTAKQLAESDFAAQARATAGTVGRAAQQGAKSAQEGFNRFVEGGPDRTQYRQVPMDESRKDFWDSFSDIPEQQQPKKSSAIGTAAMGKGGSGSGGGGLNQRPAAKKDEWDDW